MTHVMEQNESEALPEKPLYFEAVPINAPATGQTQKQTEDAKAEFSAPKKKKPRNDSKTPDTCGHGLDGHTSCFDRYE